MNNPASQESYLLKNFNELCLVADSQIDHIILGRKMIEDSPLNKAIRAYGTLQNKSTPRLMVGLEFMAGIIFQQHAKDGGTITCLAGIAVSQASSTDAFVDQLGKGLQNHDKHPERQKLHGELPAVDIDIAISRYIGGIVLARQVFDYAPTTTQR